MDRYLKTGIKAIIEERPAVGDLLDRYGIGCVPCTVGTCKLEDVLKFHHLAPRDRAQMMCEIERYLYPGREVPVPDVPDGEEPTAPRTAGYSPPVRQLVEEHKWIKRLLAVVPALAAEIGGSSRFDPQLMRGILDFIRGYADRFHHLKEEDILFDYADKGPPGGSSFAPGSEVDARLVWGPLAPRRWRAVKRMTSFGNSTRTGASPADHTTNASTRAICAQVGTRHRADMRSLNV